MVDTFICLIFVPTKNNNKQNKIMKVTTHKMTIETARQLLKAKDGMRYPNTPHNREMVAQATREFIATLHANK